MSDQPAKPPASFVGYLLMALGVLMAVLCGGCTGVWLLAAAGMTFDYAFAHTASSGQASSAGFAPVMAIGSVIFGGAPAIAGGILFFSGLEVRKVAIPRFVGWLIAGLGGTLVALSLACLAVGVFADLRWRPEDAKTAGSIVAVLIPFLICWGAPAACGWLIAWLGLRMARRAAARG